MGQICDRRTPIKAGGLRVTPANPAYSERETCSPEIRQEEEEQQERKAETRKKNEANRKEEAKTGVRGKRDKRDKRASCTLAGTFKGCTCG